MKSALLPYVLEAYNECRPEICFIEDNYQLYLCITYDYVSGHIVKCHQNCS